MLSKTSLCVTRTAKTLWAETEPRKCNTLWAETEPRKLREARNNESMVFDWTTELVLRCLCGQWAFGMAQKTGQTKFSA